MAQPVNSFDSYDMRGIREDLSDIIYDVSPEETPFYSSIKKAKAASTYHEWQTDALRSSADNAHIEGDDTAAEARSATVRLGNYTQIFKNAVTIPGTDDAITKAGRGREMAYQVMKIAKEQKLDIEKAMFANQARDAGSATTPRRLAGAGSWLTTNTSAGVGGSDPSVVDGTATRTDGTQRAFSQTLFDQVMQDIWVNGGNPNKVFLSAFQMNLALGFVGNNNQRNNVSKDTVSKNMDIYVTPWGSVEFMPTRENRGRDAWIMSTDFWCAGVLRSTRNQELAKTGDSEKRQVITELTLACLNEKASGIVADLTTS